MSLQSVVDQCRSLKPGQATVEEELRVVDEEIRAMASGEITSPATSN